MMRLLILLIVSLAAVPCPVDAAPVVPKPPWGRVIMMGASATTGFAMPGNTVHTNTQLLRLSRYVDAALLAPHEPVRNLANLLFFMNPETSGQTQIEAAVAAQPTLVIGVDFLFWFCYGQGRTDRERLQRFEHALKLLEAIRCPLILGDIPDASAAVDTMLEEHQIPSPAARTAANRRLKDWASSRPHVVILPLAAFMRAAMADQPLTVRGHQLRAGQTRELLQEDKLHPSPIGASFLAVAILDAFHTARPNLATNEVRWNQTEVFRLGSQPAVPAPSKAAN